MEADDLRSETGAVPARAPSGRTAFLTPIRRAASLAWWWHLLAVAAIVALIIAAAFQTHPSFTIAVGNRVQDEPLVVDFNAAEEQPASAGGRNYRWTRGESAVVFPGIGRTATTVTLTLAGGANPDPNVIVRANGGEIGRLRLSPDFADHTFAVPAPYLTTGNLTIGLQTTPFHAPGDRRDLGVLVSSVRVQPAGGIALPPARTALALWGAVMLLMLALLAVGLRGWEAGVATIAIAIGFAALIVRNRLFIALGAAPWLRVMAGTLMLAIALRFAVPPLLRRWRILAGLREARWLLAAAVAVFAVRLGGLYHPTAIVSDLIFHVHRFEDIIDRHIWYQEIAAIYDRNRPVPYPPGAYLLFIPFAPFVRNRADLLTIGTQLLDISRMLVVGLVVWRATYRSDDQPTTDARTIGAPAIAAACAALLAGLVPISFLVFSWGNLTNAVGEWALTLLFALLVLSADALRRPWIAAAFVAVVLLALLSHIGVAVTAVALLGVTLVGWGLLALRGWRAGRRDAVRPWLAAVGLTFVAGALAVGLFYRIPLTGASPAPTQDAALGTPAVSANRGRYEIGGPRPDPTIGLPDHRTNNPAIAIAGQLGEEGYAFYRIWPLLLAPLGWWLLWRAASAAAGPKMADGHGRRWRQRIRHTMAGTAGDGALSISQRLAAVCVVWFAASLLFLIVGVLTGRYVRYALTAIPAVAAGVGVVMAYGWRWWSGRAATILLLALSAVTTLLVWYSRITEAYHR